ncbi:MAG: ATP-binding cassette domain-containing protein [Candidatus Lokiarchaeota archaeon]|nr:ATP-binding cassette domain-containing protein [Candidatus Lokiarchaeota archaeon]MBD3342201.1 ATP-binding cassette domain-containing protein [Candidatus Lokiarchaeota archaeon]
MSEVSTEIKKAPLKPEEQTSERLKTEKSISSQTVIKLESLSKRYGKLLAVDNVNLEVREGETIGLVGPNGAGKTTIIKMIAKLLRPSSGKILVMNKNGQLQELDGDDKNLIKFGFLIDVPRFYDMKTNQILRYFATSQNYPQEKIDERINELLKLFKLSDWKHEKVSSFSKGMTQKLGIIQAILVNPKIIILDEPQSGLDPKARIEIRRIIRELQKEGKTIFVASHMLHEISEVCDKIALLNHGKIIAFDTIENLEKGLKKKELHCQILNPLDPDEKNEIISKLIDELNPWLDRGIQKDSSKPIEYHPEKREFKIYYDGKKETRGKILEKLITKFKSIFTVISFSQPSTSKLEQIYQEMIVSDEPKINSSN